MGDVQIFLASMMMSEDRDAKYEAIKLIRSVNHKIEHNAPTANGDSCEGSLL